MWYEPEAKVDHKVFEYRTRLWWLIDRAFWQGYSKRAMESFVDNEEGEEKEFLRELMTSFIPARIQNIISNPSTNNISQFFGLFLFILTIGFGYMYALWDWDDDTVIQRSDDSSGGQSASSNTCGEKI